MNIKLILWFAIAILSFYGGRLLSEGKYTTKTLPTPISQNTSANIQTGLITQIKYTARTITQNISQVKENIAANIGKQDFTINVNGEDYAFTKADDEKCMFEKNQLVLDQKSNIVINIKTEPVIIDNTKHWGFGVGLSRGGLNIIGSCPLGKVTDIVASGAVDGTVMIGVIARF